jgi:hypothetical protein
VDYSEGGARCTWSRRRGWQPLAEDHRPGQPEGVSPRCHAPCTPHCVLPSTVVHCRTLSSIVCTGVCCRVLSCAVVCCRVAVPCAVCVTAAL